MMTPADAAKQIRYVVTRLTLLNELKISKPVAYLVGLCDAVIFDDRTSAVECYHMLTSSLLEKTNRRVTGDIWKDFLFAFLIEKPNRFSSLSASGDIDPPVFEAMQNDLLLVQSLFELTSKQLIEWIATIRPKTPAIQRPLTQHDAKIANLARAAWLGGTDAALPPEKKPEQTSNSALLQQPILPNKLSESLPEKIDFSTWIQWGYAPEEKQTTYIADEALALLYRHFLAEQNWSTLAHTLGGFFAKFGTGLFLQYRFFVALDDAFLGVKHQPYVEWDSLLGQEKAKEHMYANVLRFLHTGEGEHTLLYGAEGMGKTSLVMALVNELSDIRIVSILQRDVQKAQETLKRLAGQPFKFIVFLDDISCAERDYRNLKRSFSKQILPPNVLIIATSLKKAPDSELFEKQIAFELPDLVAFSAIVQDYLRTERVYLSHDELKEACLQCQLEEGSFSIQNARKLAQRLIRLYNNKY